jgi:hypothetical protein
MPAIPPLELTARLRGTSAQQPEHRPVIKTARTTPTGTGASTKLLVANTQVAYSRQTLSTTRFRRRRIGTDGRKARDSTASGLVDSHFGVIAVSADARVSFRAK